MSHSHDLEVAARALLAAWDEHPLAPAWPNVKTAIHDLREALEPDTHDLLPCGCEVPKGQACRVGHRRQGPKR